MQTITLELPEPLYRFACQVAEATKKPLEVALRDSIAHTLPPLDDVSREEATELARLAGLDDATLWREARATMNAVVGVKPVGAQGMGIVGSPSSPGNSAVSTSSGEGGCVGCVSSSERGGSRGRAGWVSSPTPGSAPRVDHSRRVVDCKPRIANERDAYTMEDRSEGWGVRRGLTSRERGGASASTST